MADVYAGQASVDDLVTEVHLVSLLEQQQQPLYKLRVDSLTFDQYTNQDFSHHIIKTPLVDPGVAETLSTELVEETLALFLLSGERLTQMTKTYNDIEAVTRLLEEKERDLELAARIGQSLLNENKNLKNRNDELELELRSKHDEIEKLSADYIRASDRATQLKHDLSMKNGLLQIYSADLEHIEHESHSNSPEFNSNYGKIEKDKNALQASLDILNEKISDLEAENCKLRTQASASVSAIEDIERKELQLIKDCATQLTDANKQLFSLQEELARRSDDNIRQQEEITNLLTQVVELQRKVRELTIENHGYETALQVSQEVQEQLSIELIDIKEKYDTLLAAFHELQDELKKRQKLAVSQWPPSYMPFETSLAAELESLAESEGYDSEFSSLNRFGFRECNNTDTSCHTPEILGNKQQVKPPTTAQTPIGSTTRSLVGSDKLRIVKSFEGSEQLNKWRRLATPHLGVILEQNSGVQGKAIKDLNKDLFNYMLNAKAKRNSAAMEINYTIAATAAKANSPSNTTASMSYTNAIQPQQKPSTEIKHEKSSSPKDKPDGLNLFEPNPGKIFDATCSTYTFTTTCLSQSTDSTRTTPSFSAFQLSTGHSTPISSVATKTTYSSGSRPSIGRIILNAGVSLLSPTSPDTQKPDFGTSAPSPITRETSATTTTPSTLANSSWSASLRDKCTSYVKYLSGYESSSTEDAKNNQCNVSGDIVSRNNESRDELKVDNHKVHASPTKKVTLTDSARSPSPSLHHSQMQGLASMTDLEISVSSCGVITKGHDANLNKCLPMNDVIQPRPKTLTLLKDSSSQKSCSQDVCYVGSISSLKTLRKGGFV